MIGNYLGSLNTNLEWYRAYRDTVQIFLHSDRRQPQPLPVEIFFQAAALALTLLDIFGSFMHSEVKSHYVETQSAFDDSPLEEFKDSLNDLLQSAIPEATTQSMQTSSKVPAVGAKEVEKETQGKRSQSSALRPTKDEPIHSAQDLVTHLKDILPKGSISCISKGNCLPPQKKIPEESIEELDFTNLHLHQPTHEADAYNLYLAGAFLSFAMVVVL